MFDVGDRMTEATVHLFRSMAGLAVDEGPVVELSNGHTSTDIVALVGLSGSTAGMVGVYTSSRLACRVVGALLASEPTEVDEAVRDGFGEVANIIAGNVVTALGDMGETVQLSLPTVIVGHHLVTSILDTVPPRRARTFTVCGEELYVELALRRGEG